MVEETPEIEVQPQDVAAVKRAFEADLEVGALPVSFSELVLTLLSQDSDFFNEPKPPLSELVTAAGLEIRGGFIGDGPSVWRAGGQLASMRKLTDGAEDEQQREDALKIFELFMIVTGDEDGQTVTTAELRNALDLMADYGLLTLVTDQFFGDEADPWALDDADAFAQKLSAAASRPLQKAVAAWLTAVVAEHRGDPLAAAEALTVSLLHQPDYFPTIDRLAWTRSDQGRADDAKALWRQLGMPNHPDLAVLEAVTSVTAARAGMRRNEPCWCGSGRKYKVCHLRITTLPALPERFKWVLQKPIAYLNRRGGRLQELVGDVAWQLAGEQPDKVEAALENPLVVDLALHELGGFRQFLDERGPILPEDELLLYALWELVPRTLFEIVEVRREEGLTLRDLRTGDVIVVQERALTRTASAGQVMCMRVLPDGGDGHQICGGIFAIRPGHEQRLLDVLDSPDPEYVVAGLISYVVMQSRPPELQTTEGEPLLQCVRVYETANPLQIKEILDREYEPGQSGRWYQNHGSGLKKIVRTTLDLEGSTLTVTAMSEVRIGRVAAELARHLPDARLVSEERNELDTLAAPEEMPEEPTPELKAALAAWLEQREALWCEEPVPALGGLTPREAVADPTRREEVVRLINSFDTGGDEDDLPGFRPSRLRALLGLD